MFGEGAPEAGELCHAADNRLFAESVEEEPRFGIEGDTGVAVSKSRATEVRDAFFG